MANYLLAIARLFVDALGSIRWADGQKYASPRFSTLPTCAEGIEGIEGWVRGTTGVASSKQVCLKDAADAYAWEVIAHASDLRRQTVIFYTINGNVAVAADLLWTNMTAAETGFMGFNTDACDRFADLSDVTEVRLLVTCANAHTTAEARLSYSDDGSDWTAIVDCAMNTTSDQIPTKSDWTALPAAAQIEDCYLRLTGLGGNGVADPIPTYAAAEFR